MLVPLLQGGECALNTNIIITFKGRRINNLQIIACDVNS